MTTPESDQTEAFGSQSLRFVQSHMHDSTPAPAWVLDSPTLHANPIDTVLDVGCGAGIHLASIVDRFDASIGVGVEPSHEAVALLTHHYRDDQRLAFQTGSVHQLPFPSDSFDLVSCWSVLHWVGRNEYLQALGELIRVTRRHLLVMDFVAAQDYRVPYSHSEGLFTYKQDFVPAVLASGIMRVSQEGRWWDGHEPGRVERVDETDLDPFPENPLSYHARRAVIFTKDYGVLPTYSANDFGT